MDKKEIIRRLKRMSEHAVYMPGKPPFIMSLDDGVAADEAAVLLEEQPEIVRCKDCKHGEFIVQDGMLPFVKCEGVDHELDWFCADGKKRAE